MSTLRALALILNAEETLRMPLSGARLIEASAGTGKTYAISNLYLRYVLAGFSVSTILVVTFTNAATEELRGRIRLRLHDALRLLDERSAHDPAKTDDEFLASLLQQSLGMSEQERRLQCARLRLAVRTMDEAAIYTIHGFCQRALTDHAFNSGQPFELQLISNDDSLWQDALKDWWRRNTYLLATPQLDLLSRVFVSVTDLIRAQRPLREARGKRVLPDVQGSLMAQFTQWEALELPLQALAQQWRARREELQEILLNSKVLSRAKTGWYCREPLLDTLARLDRYFDAKILLGFPPQLACLSARSLHDGSTEARRGKDPALQDPFFLECQAVIEASDAIRSNVRVLALSEATTAARRQIETVKTQSRSLSFNDQLTRLHDALLAQEGGALARVLRQAFPVAMIDEFQDTDALQYSIFRTLYLNTGDAALSLTMIGDPKQAIYSFRGGDIFAYAMARADVGANVYTLDTNWRSTPALISAVNTFFENRAAPFVYEDAIAFHAVQHAEKKHAPLREEGRENPALTLWQITADDAGKTRSKGAAERLISAAVAEEIARLLVGGSRAVVALGERPVVPGDFAVLVRTGAQGKIVREALKARGINAVTAGRDNVFSSDEAQALCLVLEAIVHSSDRNSLRAALSSALLGRDYADIARISADQYAWLEWTQQIKVLQAQWQNKGFMTMFQALLQDLQVGVTLAAQAFAERRLTNLLHLAELLQQAARTAPGIESLLNWFQEQIADPEDEEGELRLESDEALVKIVTIHASKGLEYPVVFIPFLWSTTPRGKGRFEQSIAFHDHTGAPCLALDSVSWGAHLAPADKERLAEDIRLTYVALTRARASAYLVWGKVNNAYAGSSALAWLLHPEQTVEDLAVFPANVDLSDDSVRAALESLAAGRPEAIRINPMPVPSAGNAPVSLLDSSPALHPAIFTGRIASDWRITSFSSLTRDVHQPASVGRARLTNDMPVDPILNFAAGSHVGLFLHEVLENLDFQGDLRRQAQELNAKFAPRYGLDAQVQQDTVVNWISHIVKTSIDDNGMCLAALPRARRLDELEFDFAIDKVHVPLLNALLDEYAGETLQPLQVEDFRGMITGVIDLVFEHGGRYFIADYKSNLLGTSLEDYTPQRLRRAMLDRRYDLQYLLYVLALHRYLQQRLPQYDYTQQMGGAVYLFLRALRPHSGPTYGVFRDLPPPALIEKLDLLVLAAPSQGGSA